MAVRSWRTQPENLLEGIVPPGLLHTMRAAQSCAVLTGFTYASGSSGKRLQLPTSLRRVGQHPLHSPLLRTSSTRSSKHLCLVSKVVLLTYPCTPLEALKPLIVHTCRLHRPHILTSRTSPNQHIFFTGHSPLSGSVKPHMRVTVGFQEN